MSSYICGVKLESHLTYHHKKGGDDVILFTGIITKSHLIKREK
jgi:hypothetical protein|uniref:Uncharacterized protein n=1 Tax=Populus trichocarpa TaxID=3694 RepID=A0A3N7FX46_POPTR